MIPLRDLNPTRERAYLTLALIVINAAVFLVQVFRPGIEQELDFFRFGVIPRCFLAQGNPEKHKEALLDALRRPALQRALERRLRNLQARGIRSLPSSLYRALEQEAEAEAEAKARELLPQVGRRHEWLTLFSSMFMHGGWLHIIGNMWFLWIFGNNIEDVCGRIRFIPFYLLCGVIAGFAHIVTGPNSVVPTIGASGAISGVLGAYILLFPHAQIDSLIPIGYFFFRRDVPAWVFLGVWILLQLLNGIPALHNPAAAGVAWFAHIGGFIAGMGLIYLFMRRRAVPPSGIELDLDA